MNLREQIEKIIFPYIRGLCLQLQMNHRAECLQKDIDICDFTQKMLAKEIADRIVLDEERIVKKFAEELRCFREYPDATRQEYIDAKWLYDAIAQAKNKIVRVE